MGQAHPDRLGRLPGVQPAGHAQDHRRRREIRLAHRRRAAVPDARGSHAPPAQIGRASCRERVCPYVYISSVAVSLNKKTKISETIKEIKLRPRITNLYAMSV